MKNKIAKDPAVKYAAMITELRKLQRDEVVTEYKSMNGDVLMVYHTTGELQPTSLTVGDIEYFPPE